MTRPLAHLEAALQERFLFALGALEDLQRAEGNSPLSRKAEAAARELAAFWTAGSEDVEGLVLRAERTARLLRARVDERRNAIESMPSLAVMERRFTATMAAFDRCVAGVQGNVSGWDFLGGPAFVLGTARLRELETAQARADRKQLVTQWAATKTDVERWELVRRAERWYRISAETLGGCRGVVPSMSGAIVEQVGEVATSAAVAVKDAVAGIGKPLLYAGLGLGGLLAVVVLGRRS